MLDWSELPSSILHMISMRIDNPFDLIHFRSVCSWWRLSSLQTFQPVPSLRCPLPPEFGGSGDNCYILKTRVYLAQSFSSDPPLFWLFKQQEKENGALVLQSMFGRKTSSDCGDSFPSLSLDLLNSQVIELAQEHVACYTSLYDLFETDSPCESKDDIGLMQLDAEKKEFMVLGKLSFEGLGIYRSSEDCWTEIDTTPCPFTEAIISFNGHIYVIDPFGVTKVVKPSLELTSFQRSRSCDKTRKRWLVKADDKLLLVEMCTEDKFEYLVAQLLPKKGWFEVSELNEEKNDWIQVENVDGHILFLDHYCSFSCRPNQIQGIGPNSIFFKTMHRDYGLQVFEFGMQGFRSIKDIPEYNQLFPSSLWIVSNGGFTT